MEAAEVPRWFRTILLGHHVLYALEDLIHGGVAVRAGSPLAMDLGMTPPYAW